jgi:hypothetical protein
MLDAVSKAMQDIKRKIPRQILNEAFRFMGSARANSIASIDDSIRQRVINNRVMVDVSLLGGSEMRLPLDSAEIEYVDSITQIYRFPKSITNGRSIMTALSLEFYNPYMTQWLIPAQGTQQAPLTLQLGRMMVDVHTPQPKTFTGRTTVIGENAILVQGFNMPISNYCMRVVLEYTERMQELNPRYYTDFSKLCVLAAKAYCYWAIIIDSGEAKISAGRELGVFMSELEKYSDADDQYEELKETWPAIAMLNDDESMKNLLALQCRGF